MRVLLLLLLLFTYLYMHLSICLQDNWRISCESYTPAELGPKSNRFLLKLILQIFMKFSG